MSVLRNRVSVAKSVPPADQPPKPPPAVSWFAEPLAGWGMLQIGEVIYRVQEVEYDEPNGQRRMLVRLARAGAEQEYQLVPDSDGTLRCDCPDSVFRAHEKTCKHCVAVTAVYEQLAAKQRLAAFLAADAPGTPADDANLSDEARAYLNRNPIPF